MLIGAENLFQSSKRGDPPKSSVKSEVLSFGMTKNSSSEDTGKFEELLYREDSIPSTKPGGEDVGSTAASVSEVVGQLDSYSRGENRLNIPSFVDPTGRNVGSLVITQVEPSVPQVASDGATEEVMDGDKDDAFVLEDVDALLNDLIGPLGPLKSIPKIDLDLSTSKPDVPSEKHPPQVEATETAKPRPQAYPFLEAAGDGYVSPVGAAKPEVPVQIQRGNSKVDGTVSRNTEGSTVPTGSPLGSVKAEVVSMEQPGAWISNDAGFETATPKRADVAPSSGPGIQSTQTVASETTQLKEASSGVVRTLADGKVSSETVTPHTVGPETMEPRAQVSSSFKAAGDGYVSPVIADKPEAPVQSQRENPKVEGTVSRNTEGSTVPTGSPLGSVKAELVSMEQPGAWTSSDAGFETATPKRADVAPSSGPETQSTQTVASETVAYETVKAARTEKAAGNGYVSSVVADKLEVPVQSQRENPKVEGTVSRNTEGSTVPTGSPLGSVKAEVVSMEQPGAWISNDAGFETAIPKMVDVVSPAGQETQAPQTVASETVAYETVKAARTEKAAGDGSASFVVADKPEVPVQIQRGNSKVEGTVSMQPKGSTVPTGSPLGSVKAEVVSMEQPGTWTSSDVGFETATPKRDDVAPPAGLETQATQVVGSETVAYETVKAARTEKAAGDGSASFVVADKPEAPAQSQRENPRFDGTVSMQPEGSTVPTGSPLGSVKAEVVSMEQPGTWTSSDSGFQTATPKRADVVPSAGPETQATQTVASEIAKPEKNTSGTVRTWVDGDVAARTAEPVQRPSEAASKPKSTYNPSDTSKDVVTIATESQKPETEKNAGPNALFASSWSPEDSDRKDQLSYVKKDEENSLPTVQDEAEIAEKNSEGISKSTDKNEKEPIAQNDMRSYGKEDTGKDQGVDPSSRSAGELNGPGTSRTAVTNAQTATRNIPLPGRGPEILPQGLAQVVRQVASDGTQRASIVVEPPALGRVEVEVHVTPSGMEASFKVDSVQVRDMIKPQIPLLQDMLAQQGISASSVNVDVRQGDDRRSPWRDSIQSVKGRRGRTEDDDEVPEESIVTIARIDLERGMLQWYA